MWASFLRVLEALGVQAVMLRALRPLKAEGEVTRSRRTLNPVKVGFRNHMT